MAKPLYNRLSLYRRLEAALDQLTVRHHAEAPRNGIPVGGGEWMDTFFRMEALRGCLSALRAGKPLSVAIAAGQATSSEAVLLWNSRREYQVHRWDRTAWSWLEQLVWRSR